MALPSFDAITNLFLGSALGNINNNFAKVREQFENSILRDGTQEMLSNLDMNGKRLINLSDGLSDSQAATVRQLKTAVIGAGGVIIEGGGPNAVATVSELRANDVEKSPVDLTLEGLEGTFFFTLEDFTGKVDNVNIFKQDDTPLTVGAWVRQDANSLKYQYDGDNTKPRAWSEVQSKRVELSGFKGADPTGGNDSYEALQAAIAKAYELKAELIIDGGFRIKMLPGRAPILFSLPITVRGAQHRSGNIPNTNAHGAALYFDQDAAESIVINDTQVTFDRCAIVGPSRVSTYPGIKVVGLNAAIRLTGGAVVQSWQTALKIENGYYHRINDATIADCVNGIVLSGGANPAIYNFVAHQLKIVAAPVAGSICASITGGSQASFTQCSFESFLGDGFVVQNSSVDIFSSYFEGNGGYNVHLFEKGKVNAKGNRVYLSTGANRFISVDGSGAVGCQVISEGNHFVIPYANGACAIYSLLNNDAAAVSNIGEDEIINIVDLGSAFRYLADGFFAGTGPVGFMGSHDIRFPAGTPRMNSPVKTGPIQIYPAIAGLGSAPPASMLMPYACNGNGTAGTLTGDDPGDWRSNGWGANPMLMTFNRSSDVPAGQWEKVGLRLPNIAAPTGGATVDAEARAWITALRTALNKQGVMKLA